MDLSANLTPLVRVLIPVLFGIYVLDLVLSGLLTQWLSWQPLGAGFQPWQVLTCWLTGVGMPFNELLSLLMLFFFVPMVERLYSYSALLRVWALAWGAAVVGVGLSLLVPFIQDSGVQSALPSFIVFLIALIGYRMPTQQFLLMMVLPVKAVWLARFDGLLALLNLLAFRNTGSVAPLVVWCVAWLITHWSGLDDGIFRRLGLRFKRARIARAGGKFTVIDGGREKRSDWVN